MSEDVPGVGVIGISDSGVGPPGNVQVSDGAAPGRAPDSPLGAAGVPGNVDGGAAPSPTSGSPTGRSISGGGTPAGRTIASICALVSLMR